jgi:hypothetical protein
MSKCAMSTIAGRRVMPSRLTQRLGTNRLGWRFLSLKTLLFVIFSLWFTPSVVVVISQDAPYLAPKTRADIGARVTTIMGTVQEDGEKLRFVTEQRAWKVDNPELLKGHEGHYVHAAAYIYPDRNLIRIVEVRIPTARETSEADIK